MSLGSRLRRWFGSAHSGAASQAALPPVPPQWNALQAFGHAYAANLLGLFLEKGWLDKAHIQHVCDFGAGLGGPAFALLHVLAIRPASLTLLESHSRQAAQLKRMLPESLVIEGDGLAWMAVQRKPYDLITAFMLGPDSDDGMLAFSFISQALPRLAQGGKLLICSDTATMHGVRQRLASLEGLCCKWLIDPGENVLLPVTVLVSKAADNEAFSNSSWGCLPSPVIKSAEVADAQGHREMEHYCLTTEFERAYLRATISAFETEMPEHPGVEAMKKLLD